MKSAVKGVLLASSMLAMSVLCCGRGLVLVNGQQLFLQCEGTGAGPTVILMAGYGGTTDTWDKVQRRVSAFARVCSYDRAGLGRSGAIPEPQSVDQIVNDLETLLRVAHVPPPYVLVGHSIGGIYIRKFDEHNDPLVAGMVLVDSSHEEQIWRFAQDEPEALKEYSDWKNVTAMSRQGFLPPGERLQWHFAKPLIVIEHGIPPEPVWHKMQQDLAARSPDGRLITASQSSHSIPKMQPEPVIESIRTVLSQSRAQ